ncbi:MAG: ABC transporter ATP-binding protein [Gammaproteobacteria bacterium]|nr:ABC transporter ATP-binding protein [Gammaproteobacteria bacterium]
MLALEVRDLRKVYSSKVEALRGVSLQVQEGDFFALLGPNGAGKTTLIGIVTSLVNKTSGNVQIFGHDLDSQKSFAKSMIGLVPQEFNLAIFEKVENILLQQAGYYGIPRSLAKQRAEKYLKNLDLWEKRDSQVRELSSGMKRRLMFARAMMHEPKLLILDEPTAGVDLEIRRSMWDFIKGINQQGITIILTTHYLEEAENLCRNVAIIDHGEIITDTSVSSLLSALQMESFILFLAEPCKALPSIDGLIMRKIDDKTLEVDVQKTHSMNEVFEILSANNISVNSMRNKVNRLEEMFMLLTKNGKS